MKGRERLKERGGGREREREREGGKACQKHVSRPTSEVGSRMAVCWSTLTAIFCWSSSHQSALWGPNISLINFSSLSPREREREGGRLITRERDRKRESSREREGGGGGGGGVIEW